MIQGTNSYVEKNLKNNSLENMIFMNVNKER